jgi:uncharacterized protein (DUF697 family)
MLGKLKSWLKPPGDLQARLDELTRTTPMPVFWLFGKTQSGKTSIIKFLTGAGDAEIGQGFRPCTRFSREFQFPSAAAPLLVFLDTRGLEEPGYDPREDLEHFHTQAHVVIVTVRVLDHAVENTVNQLRVLRSSQPTRPVVLALTCLHEVYPGRQHPESYPFLQDGSVPATETDPLWLNLSRSINLQIERFGGLHDYVVPLDFTPADEGFNDPAFGGPRLTEVLFRALPEAYRQTFMNLETTTHALQDYYERLALPYILGFSGVAATAGAIPLPWIDLLLLPGIQTRMIYKLAALYGQPLSGPRFLEFAATLGLGMLVRQGIRELVKFIPVVGAAAGAALAASATFALGKAFCYYYGAVQKGHVPTAADLKRYYHDQLQQAERLWQKPRSAPKP